MRRTAETLLPLLCAKGDVAAHKAALENLFLAPAQSRETGATPWPEVVLAGDAPTFSVWRPKRACLEVLEFVAEFVLSPPLHLAAKPGGRTKRSLG